MHKDRQTLAVYGIQDREDYEYPFYVHDHNLTLTENGEISAFLQLERKTRRKRDNTLHIHLKDILREKKMIPGDYDLVFIDNTVGRTFITRNGDARFEAPLNQDLKTTTEKGKCWWFGEEREACIINHELAHICTCLPFFGIFKENSLLVHFDGGASLSNFSAALYKNGQIKWLEYHWDLKPYSAIFNANALVFSIIRSKLSDQNSIPGKFMGYAGLGEYNGEIEKWLIENNYFEDIWRTPSVFFRKAKDRFGIDLKSFNQKNPFIKDVASTLQNIFIKKIISKLGELAEKTRADYLYYTGGSALNIVANTQIVKNSVFKDVFIPPCTEDSGLSVGASAFAEWMKQGVVKRVNPYLNNWGIESYKVNYSPDDISVTAEKIVQGKIIGICNGFGEAGPRALGNHSIIAMANSKKSARDISINKKGREWYRPLAPVALEKNTRYFTGEKSIHHLSKYMLLDFKVLPDKRDEIPGVVHADGTARFQTIFEKRQNPFLYDLLIFLDMNYGIKALINTSFNGKDEPMVHTEYDAIATAEKLKLDYMLINGKLKVI